MVNVGDLTLDVETVNRRKGRSDKLSHHQSLVTATTEWPPRQLHSHRSLPRTDPMQLLAVFASAVPTLSIRSDLNPPPAWKRAVHRRIISMRQNLKLWREYLNSVAQKIKRFVGLLMLTLQQA